MFRYVDDVFSTARPGVGVNLVYFFLEGVFFFLLTLLIEVCLHRKLNENINYNGMILFFFQYKFFIPEIRGLFLKNGEQDVATTAIPLEGEVCTLQ